MLQDNDGAGSLEIGNAAGLVVLDADAPHLMTPRGGIIDHVRDGIARRGPTRDDRRAACAGKGVHQMIGLGRLYAGAADARGVVSGCHCTQPG